MNEGVAESGAAASPTPVAPSRQCVGCGFDVMGIAMDGVCSECQKPVRETVLRPMLRDNPRWARWVQLGAWMVLTDLALTIILAALNAATSLGVLPSAPLLTHKLTNWATTLTFCVISSGAMTLLAVASRAPLTWLLLGLFAGLLPPFIALTNQWLNASPTIPGIRTWMLTSNIVNIVTVSATYFIYAHATWMCSRLCDSFALRTHARRLYLAAVVGIPLLTLFAVSIFVLDGFSKTSTSDPQHFETAVDLLSLAGTITGAPFVVAMFLYGSWVVFHLAKAAKAEATFASTLPP